MPLNLMQERFCLPVDPNDTAGQIRWLEQYLYPDFSVEWLLADWEKFWKRTLAEEPSRERRLWAEVFFRGVRECYDELTATRH